MTTEEIYKFVQDNHIVLPQGIAVMRLDDISTIISKLYGAPIELSTVIKLKPAKKPVPTKAIGATIDRVTTTNLEAALRAAKIVIPIDVLDTIIDITEIIETKGDNITIKDILPFIKKH